MVNQLFGMQSETGVRSGIAHSAQQLHQLISSHFQTGNTGMVWPFSTRVISV